MQQAAQIRRRRPMPVAVPVAPCAAAVIDAGVASHADRRVRLADDDRHAATGSVEIVINKANATINVTGYTGVYDGKAHGRDRHGSRVEGVAGGSQRPAAPRGPASPTCRAERRTGRLTATPTTTIGNGSVADRDQQGERDDQRDRLHGRL